MFRAGEHVRRAGLQRQDHRDVHRQGELPSLRRRPGPQRALLLRPEPLRVRHVLLLLRPHELARHVEK